MQDIEIQYAVYFLKREFVFNDKDSYHYYKFDSSENKFINYYSFFDRTDATDYYNEVWTGSEEEFKERLSAVEVPMFQTNFAHCFYHWGIELYYSGDIINAEEKFKTARHYHVSSNSPFIYNMDFADALIAQSKGNSQKAAELIRKATNAFTPLLWHALSTVFGYLYDDVVHNQKIADTCLLLLEADPENWELHYELASAYLKLNRIEAAELSLAKADQYYDSQTPKEYNLKVLNERIQDLKNKEH